MASLLAFGLLLTRVLAADPEPLPYSSPHSYAGMPKGALGPNWQSYYEVTDPLPNVTFPLTRSFAGNLPVGRSGKSNATLFFWAYEKANGSLTDEDSTEPWGIWLNGGPGSSSLLGMLYENGPIRINPDYSASPNPHSWNTVADFFWIDQPVGVGFATAGADEYISDEPGMAGDFIGFLGNLVKVFPSLAKRPLYLTGESYAGMYIPYIMKAYTSMPDPPVKIAKIAIGNPTIGTWQEFNLLPTVSVLRTFPQLIGYDPEVFEWFLEQEHLCGYDLNLTYPSTSPLPYIPLSSPRDRTMYDVQKARQEASSKMLARRDEIDQGIDDGFVKPPRRGLPFVSREKRDLSGRARGEIDPWYGCWTFDAYIDYAVNFTYPWNSVADAPAPMGAFDVYNIPSILWPYAPEDGTVFMNDERTRAALHAPVDKDWASSFDYPFGELGKVDPSVEPISFLDELATNLTSQNIGVVLYSGNNDALIPHYGTEVAIQNTTFGGIRGFTRKPSTPWTTDDGQFAGIIHQERGWTYALIDNAGHLVPTHQPVAALEFIREFVFGNNTLGSVLPDGNLVGGGDPKLESGIIPGPPEAYLGAGATETTYVFPQETRAAWDSYAAKEFSTALENGAPSLSPFGLLLCGVITIVITHCQ